jgi:hypothetical protein
VCCGFRRQFNQQETPSPIAIRQYVKQWLEEGSVTNNKSPRRRSVRTPENIVRVLESAQCSQKKSACRHSVAIRMSDGSVRRVLHSLT